MRLLFQNLTSFVDELGKYGPNVEPIVRINRYNAQRYGAEASSNMLIASYLRRVVTHFVVVTLEYDCDSASHEDYDQRIHLAPTTESRSLSERIADQIEDKLTKAASSLDLEVRSGIYTDA